LLLAATYAVAVLSVELRPGDNPVAVWWPAAALSVLLVALCPRGVVPLVGAVAACVVVTGLANLTGGRALDASLAFGVSNAAEALLAGLVLRARPHPGPPALVTLADYVRLVAAAALGGATIALGAGLTTATLLDGSFLMGARTTFSSHAAAVLVVVPLALVWRGGARTARPEELPVQVGALALSLALVFRPDQALELTFLPLVLLVWAALRLELRVVALELVAFAAVTTYLTARGWGPFAADVASRSASQAGAASMCQLYLVCASLLTVPLALVLAERNRLVAQVSAEEVLFRRNFTDSLLGQLLLRIEDGELRVVDANDTAAEVVGLPAGSLVGRPLDQLLVTPHEVGVRLAAGQSWRGRTSVRGHDATRVEVALSRLSHGEDDDRRVVWSAQLLDVSAEHVARQRHEAAERLTSATLDTTAAIILVTDLDGRVVRVNAATTELTGWTEDDLVGRTLTETSLTGGATPDLEALFLWPNRSGQPVVREGDARTRSGKTLRILWSNNMVRDEQGMPSYAVLTGIDVTTERASAGLVSHLMRAAITTAIIGVDETGRITVFNRGAEMLLDHDAARRIGQRFVDLLDADQVAARLGTRDPDEAFAALVRDLGSGELPARDWEWVARDRSRRTVSMTLSATESTGAVGFLVVGRDVTEQRQGQDMLVAALEKERTAVDRLRALDEAKNEFVSTVSHELRTPVTSIVGYTEMLQDGTVVDPLEEQLPLFDTIARNGQRLIVLCNDLLTLAGLDSESITWEAEQVDLGRVLGAVQEATAPLLADRDLEVVFDAPADPVVVVGDPAQLERVVLNLVTNALKFTEDGGVVRARVEVAGDEAVLTVTDTGIGIPTEEQANLFQKFFRSSTAQKEAIQGTGLGLSIVSAIVSAHGGTIRVRSAHLEGATFTVRLPLKY
jgi:PAS domain S-box-containing protein